MDDRGLFVLAWAMYVGGIGYFVEKLIVHYAR